MNPTNYTFREQAKAIVGALLAGLTAFGTALADGTVSPVEWVGVAIAVLATYGTVFGVSNGVQRRNEHGYIDPGRGAQFAVIIGAVVLVGIVLLFFVAP